MFTTLTKTNMSFKNFDCSELFSETPCCPERDEEKFCIMQNNPNSKTWEVLRVEVHSCCKHVHQAKKLPIEFFLEHHKPYVIRECAKTPTMKRADKKAKGEDDDWLW